MGEDSEEQEQTFPLRPYGSTTPVYGTVTLSSEKAADEPDEFDRLGSRMIDLGCSTFQCLAQYIRFHTSHFPTVTQNLTNQGEQAVDAPH